MQAETPDLVYLRSQPAASPVDYIREQEKAGMVTLVQRNLAVYTCKMGPNKGPKGDPGPSLGPVGPKGDTGSDGRDGQIRFTGHGLPGTIIGSSLNDTYLDLDTGNIHKLG